MHLNDPILSSDIIISMAQAASTICRAVDRSTSGGTKAYIYKCVKTGNQTNARWALQPVYPGSMHPPLRKLSLGLKWFSQKGKPPKALEAGPGTFGQGTLEHGWACSLDLSGLLSLGEEVFRGGG